MITPYYYQQFSCKQSSCRHSCCHDWKVSLSELDYFKLLGLNCSKDLRWKLDASLHIEKNPTDEYYAELARNWEGKCPCETKDGLCALQLNVGEEHLPEICRSYPRSRTDNIAHCTNSCEKVIELMMKYDDPFCLGTLENIVPNKAAMLSVLFEKNGSTEDKLLKIARDVFVFDGTQSQKLAAACAILSVLMNNSQSIRKYGTEALDILSNLDCVELFALEEEKFSKIIPDYDSFYTNILINFELADDISEADHILSVKALCTAYTILKIVTVCYTAEKGTKEAFVESAAGVFRYFQHTLNENMLNYIFRSLSSNELVKFA